MTGEIACCAYRLRKWCVGNGVDLGFGGNPINDTAICIDRDENDPRRAKVPAPFPPTHFVGDVSDLPFKDGVLDYVFSSHCLEDFEDTKAVLTEWWRVIKPGGFLVLFLPDQPAYESYCASLNVSPNGHHKHRDFSLAFVKDKLPHDCRVVHELFPTPNNAYSFDLVVQKLHE